MNRKSILALTVISLLTLASSVKADTATKDIVNVTAAAAAKLIKEDSKMVVVDIRTEKEFTEGHIAKAVNIDFMAKDFETKLAKLDRSKSYIMHCKSGGRSTKSLAIWKKLGFKKVYHLDSGYLGWQKAGQAEVKGK